MSEAFRQGPQVLPEFRTQVVWRRAKVGKNSRPLAFRLIESVGIIFAATLAYLAIGELAVRVAMRAPLTDWQDFRHERAAGTINKAVEYDGLLGWRLKSQIKSPGFNTLDYGFRSNGDADAKIQTGGVLAVGSSFTAGSEVVDDQSWPAQLKELTGWNVNNGGQGGYQADQIVLLAEQLLPLIRPQVIVVDLIPGTIIGTGYASSGWPKPYFTIENGDLVMHNSPVPHSEAVRSDHLDVKRYLGHFAVVDQFMAAFFANAWFTADGNSFAPVSTDEVGVTCRLLERLKQKTDAAGVHVIVYLQYGGLEIVDGSRIAASRTANGGTLYALRRRIKNKLKAWLLNLPPGAPDWNEASAGVGECARGLGIATADELPALRSAYEQNPNALRKYYHIEPDGSMGHKSLVGNRDVAERVAVAIRELQPPGDQKSK
jgi:hypothetical protein